MVPLVPGTWVDTSQLVVERRRCVFDSFDDEVKWIRPIAECAAVLILPTLFSFLLIALILITLPPIGRVLDRVDPGPMFVFELCGGLLLTVWHCNRTGQHSRALYWMWVIPFVFLVLNHIWPPPNESPVTVLKTELGINPTDEGLTSILVTAPMLGAIAYSVGRLLLTKLRTRSQSQKAVSFK